MSSVPIKMKQLGLKASKFPKSHDNDGFESNVKAKSHMGENWKGKVKGKTKHTYEAGD